MPPAPIVPDPSASSDDARARLLALAAAYNKAVLAGAAAGVVAALACVAGALFVATHGYAWTALPALVAAALIVRRTWRLHGRVIRDLGPARRAAADVVVLLRARGGSAPLRDVETRVARDDLERALDFLGRLGLVYAEPGGADGDVLKLDPERARALESRG